jgi:hypothetical protein
MLALLASPSSLPEEIAPCDAHARWRVWSCGLAAELVAALAVDSSSRLVLPVGMRSWLGDDLLLAHVHALAADSSAAVPQLRLGAELTALPPRERPATMDESACHGVGRVEVRRVCCALSAALADRLLDAFRDVELNSAEEVVLPPLPDTATATFALLTGFVRTARVVRPDGFADGEENLVGGLLLAVAVPLASGDSPAAALAVELELQVWRAVCRPAADAEVGAEPHAVFKDHLPALLRRVHSLLSTAHPPNTASGRLLAAAAAFAVQCVGHPHLGEAVSSVIPVALRLMDDVHPSSKGHGAAMLHRLINESNKTQLSWHAELLVKELFGALVYRDVPALRLLLPVRAPSPSVPVAFPAEPR